MAAGFLGLWDRIVRSEIKQEARKRRILPFVKNKEVQFYQEAIVVHKNGQTKVFSSHCTHLGCVINHLKDGKLICPCHGSEFDLNGAPVKGPAVKPLESLKFELDPSGDQLIIKT